MKPLVCLPQGHLFKTVLTVIQGLRKSLRDKKSAHSSISSPISERMTSVSSSQDIQFQGNLLQSPKKVIKALFDYKPQGPGELEFSKGDFFHVIGNEDDPEWYEACDPKKNIRGMVPVPYFEVFGKTRPITPGAPTSTAHRSSPQSKKLSTDSMPTSVSSKGSSGSALYAIVLYEFKAERSDELDVNAGENIILCAHHNYEWFIAKPIDRLGGPGLVPVSYVSVIDILTGQSTGNDVIDDITSANLPTVDEWKNKNAKYKASSIPLGNVDENFGTPGMASRTTSHYQERASSRLSNLNPRAASQATMDMDVEVDNSTPYVTDAAVDAFHVDNGRYWFHVRCELSNGEQRSLCRYYEDFYDFQIRLLELFPAEAGRSSQNHKRILPFIPGPLTYVTDKITKKRQIDLNDYVKELIELPAYISHSQYLKFFYRDDIFALLLPKDITVAGLRNKVKTRIYDDDVNQNFKIYIKENDGPGAEVLTEDDVLNVLDNKLKMIIDDE
ncbi:Bud emergence protein 1 [Cyberlindnera fabianii]|uniref:Bud emergence protein 1 n=1 Tax=Cyberlindnera fabianii TaxID=36022 RepID=A0A1V2L8T2_CYBFA|nr:Bud emergence protein 1 [Cyberlindnera fabianii]